MAHDRFPTFGLELSDTAVRVAECRRRRKDIELHLLFEVPLRPGTIHDGDILDPARVSRALRELSRMVDVQTHYAALALPERHTFLKLLSIPQAKTSAPDESVLWEATQHFPFSPEEAYYDWERVGEAESGKETYLVAASPKEFVDRYTALFDGLRIIPAVFEPETLSLWRAMAKLHYGTRPFLGVVVNAYRTLLLLCDRQSVRFTAVDAFSGSLLNQTIAQKMRLSLADAQKAQRLFGLDPKKGKGATRTVLQPLVLSLTKKILHTVSAWRDQTSTAATVDHVYLAGPHANIYGFAAYLQEVVGISASSFDAPAFLSLQKNVAQAVGQAPLSLATVIGLSLRDIL